MRSFASGSLLLAAASMASAALQINNWCTTDVYIYQSNNGGCDAGSDGSCNANPWVINAGNGAASILALDWIANGYGTSVKIATDASFANGILQLEYTMSSGGLYWDLSDLDGSGAGLVGTPFAAQNVKVSPTGDGAGSDSCVQIRCPANQLCVNAYQAPDDNDSRFCPADTGDMWLDLCEADPAFSSRKRSIRTGRRA